MGKSTCLFLYDNKQNNLYTITIYEVESDTSIEWCFTNLDNNNSNNKISIYSCLEIKNSPGL